MSIAAKAMNVTTGELEQMIQKGISAEEFLPKFSAELRKSVRDGGALAASLKTVTAAQERLSTQLQLGIRDFSGAGGKEGIVDIFEGLTFVVKSLIPLLKIAGVIFKAIGNHIRTQFRIYGGVLNIIIDSIKYWNSLLALIPGVGRNIGEAKDEATGLLKVFEDVLDVAQRIQGIIQLTVGFIERIARGDFKSFVDDYKKLQQSEGPTSGPGFLSGMIPIPGISSTLTTGTALARSISSGGNSKVNSDNTITASISVANGDPNTIATVFEDLLQNKYKLAY